jgi:hypothetical protein
MQVEREETLVTTTLLVEAEVALGRLERRQQHLLLVMVVLVFLRRLLGLLCLGVAVVVGLATRVQLLELVVLVGEVTVENTEPLIRLLARRILAVAAVEANI